MVRDAGEMREQARRRTYDSVKDGAQGDLTQGSKLFRPESKVATWNPEWNNGETVFRILPCPAPDNITQFDPWRLSSTPRHWGDWFRRYYAVKGMGPNKLTYWIGDHSTTPGWDPKAQNPTWIFHDTINRAVATGTMLQPTWAASCGTKYVRGILPEPDWLVVLQVAIWRRGKKSYTPAAGSNPQRGTLALCLTSSAWRALQDAMDKTVDGYRGDPEDWAAMYTHGDPVALDKGAFIHLFNAKDDPRLQAAGPAGPRPTAFGTAAGAAGGGDEPGGFGKYDCFLTSEYAGQSPNLSGYEDMVRQIVKPWDDVLYFPSDAEQIVLLSNMFDPLMINYVFGQDTRFRQYIPEAVHKAMHDLGTYNTPVAPAAHAAPVAGFGVPGVAPRQPAAAGFGAPPASYPAAEPVPAAQPAAPPVPPPVQSATRPPAASGFGAAPAGGFGNGRPDPAAPTGGIDDTPAAPTAPPAEAAPTTTASARDTLKEAVKKTAARSRQAAKKK